MDRGPPAQPAVRAPREPAAAAVGILLVTGHTAYIVDGVAIASVFAAANSAFSLQNSTTTGERGRATSRQPRMRAARPLAVEMGHSRVRGPGAKQSPTASTASARRRHRQAGQGTDPRLCGFGDRQRGDGAGDVVIRELKRARRVHAEGAHAWSPRPAPDGSTRMAVDPMEYMYNGDTAMVAMQYSYLPSWISFLVDKERAREAGRDLFDAGVRGLVAAAAASGVRSCWCSAKASARSAPSRHSAARRHAQPGRRDAAGRPAEPQRAVERDRRRPRSGQPRGAAELRAGRDGAVRRRSGRRPGRPTAEWDRRASSTCNTRPTRSCGGRPR